MNEIDMSQRIEEIELALSTLFESPKNPAVSSYEEATAFFVQISWVVESHRDTTLDARCVVTVRFSPGQMSRYAAMDTANRIVVRERLCDKARSEFSAQQCPPTVEGDCSLEVAVEDALFAVEQPPY
ncbi:MAG: DUF3022 domain-containing protein [Paraburkholderia sp.]|uniref:DUF3022 domain-containing protein n=1 Tax=Paraburkholderia sp. TaxID=1926495 RepID=UPI003C50A970